MEGESLESLTLSSCFVCYICGDFYKRPRVLPCGHTFCSECLAKLRDDIVSDGQRSDLDQMTALSDPTHVKFGNGVSKNPTTTTTTLSPESSESKDTAVCDSSGASNGVTFNDLTGQGERKPSSSCVDDVDGVLNQPPSLTTSLDQWPAVSMSTSATYTCLREKDKPIQKQTTIPKHTSHGCNKHEGKISIAERSPSMIANHTPQTKSKQCSQCGNVMTSQRNSSTSPIKRSTSMTSTREGSPSSLKDLPRWNNSSPNRKSVSHLQPPACSYEHKHGREMEPFVCPIPQCNYSMRVMNLARWSPKNKTLANAVAVWQRQHAETRDSSTQTAISNKHSVLVTIPRHLVTTDPSSSLLPSPSSSPSLVPLTRRTRHASMVDIAIDQTVSLEGPLQQPGYVPRGHYTWRTYAAMALSPWVRLATQMSSLDSGVNEYT